MTYRTVQLYGIPNQRSNLESRIPEFIIFIIFIVFIGVSDLNLQKKKAQVELLFFLCPSAMCHCALLLCITNTKVSAPKPPSQILAKFNLHEL